MLVLHVPRLRWPHQVTKDKQRGCPGISQREDLRQACSCYRGRQECLLIMRVGEDRPQMDAEPNRRRSAKGNIFSRTLVEVYLYTSTQLLRSRMVGGS